MRKTSYLLFALSLMGLVNTFISAGVGMSILFVVLPRLLCSIYLLVTAYWVFRESLVGYRLGIGALALLAAATMTSPLWALSRIEAFGVEAFALGTLGLIATGTWCLYRGLNKWKQIYQSGLDGRGDEKKATSHSS